MDLTLRSPRNSFIKFTANGNSASADNCCQESEEFCLPVIEENDLIFQFSIVCGTVAEANTLLLYNGNQVVLQLLSSIDPSSIVVVKSYNISDGLIFEKYLTGPKEITFLWRNPLANFKTDIACGQCFWLAVAYNDTGDETQPTNVRFYSDCLKRACASCYTSVLEYYCNEDYDEFRYCNVDDVVNRVRLPFYLRQMQFVDEGSRYRKSGGQIKVTKQITTKKYQAETEYFPEHIHEKLKIALGHDEKAITGERYTGGIDVPAEYKIEWFENMCVAPATFEAVATPYLVRNNNCEDCDGDFGCPVVENFLMGYNVYDWANPDTQKFTFDWDGPTVGVSPFIRIEYRAAGSSDPWLAMPAGFPVLTDGTVNNTHPVQIAGFPLGSFEFRASIVSEDCVRTYTPVIGPYGLTSVPSVSCEAVTGLLVEDLAPTSATAQWNASSPTPAGLYDYELLGSDHTTVVAADTGYWNPGTLIVGLTGLTTGTTYYFRVRANCDGILGYSTWTEVSFTTP